MRKLFSWLSSWATTLHIMLFERETYRTLTETLSAPGEDFTEAHLNTIGVTEVTLLPCEGMNMAHNRRRRT